MLGLAVHIELEGGGWVDLAAGGGRVALHSATGSDTGGLPGQTRLSFEVDDVETLAVRLIAAGFEDATPYDEAYGRALTVTDPLGDQLIIDERIEDLYGYRLHDAGGAQRSTRVVPVRFTDAGEDYGRHLTLQTGADLAELAEQLRAAGYPGVALTREDFGSFVDVTDPDGQSVQIHELATRASTARHTSPS